MADDGAKKKGAALHSSHIEEQKELVQSAETSSILPRLTPKFRENLAAKIDTKPSGLKAKKKCHRWTGALSNGYGRVCIGPGKKNEQVHRVVWVLTHGVEIPKGGEIAHTCDERDCANPDHLVLKTHAANMSTVQGPMSAAEFRARCVAHRDRRPIEPLSTDAAVTFLERVWAGVNQQIGLLVSTDNADRKTLRRLLAAAPDEQTAYGTLVYVVKNWSRFTHYAAGKYAVFNDYSKLPPAHPVLAVLRTTPGLDAALNFYAESERRREEAQREAEYQRRELERQRRKLERQRVKEWQRKVMADVFDDPIGWTIDPNPEHGMVLVPDPESED